MPQPQRTVKLQVKVDAPGVKEALDTIQKSLGGINKNVKNLSGNLGFLTNAFRGWIGYLGVREFAQMSDSMQNMQNRLKIVTGSTEGATEAMKGLVELADRTNQSVDGVGQVYNRLALSMRDTGASTKQLMALSESLINSFRVAGATTTETVNTVVQLSQAFASGQLRGQELRTVMEQNATLAQLLRQRFGQDIYKKAEKGAIGVADVLDVLAKNMVRIDSEAAKLAPTFEQVLTKATNQLSLKIGELNTQFRLAEKFGTLMGFAVRNLGEIVTLLAGAAMVNAIINLESLTNGIRALGIALASANPYLLALTGLVTAGSLIALNWSSISPILNRIGAELMDIYAMVSEKLLPVFEMLHKFTGGQDSARRNRVFSEGQIKYLKFRADQIRAEAAGPFGPQETPEMKAKREIKEREKEANALRDLYKKNIKDVSTLKEEFADLNKWFSKTKDVEGYAKKLRELELKKIEENFKTGKITLDAYNKAISKVNIKEFEADLTKGNITLSQFNASVAAERLKVLNAELALGVISLSEFNKEIIKLEDKTRFGSAFYAGIEGFIESVGTLSEGIAKSVGFAFDQLSVVVADFIRGRTVDFKKFANAVLDDIALMIARAAIVRPIAQGIMGLAGGLFSAPAGFGGENLGRFGPQPAAFANGGIMTSKGPLPLNMYANGGIANSPQVSMFGEGRRPEAYVPLPDGRSIPVSMEGGGGVSVSQTIIINGDGTSSSNNKTNGQNAKELGDMIRKVTMDTIIQQRRPGGVLS